MAATQKRHATLGDLVFGGIDALGTRVYLRDIKGWDAGAPSTGSVQQRAADDGGWLDQAYLAPRVIELDLYLVGDDFLTVTKSINAIDVGLPLNVPDVLVVNNHGQELQAKVRKQGEVLPTQKGASATVSVSLLAPDPRRYSTGVVTASTGLPETSGGMTLPLALPLAVGASTASGVLVAVNDGNEAAHPVFTIDGPCPAGATITLRSTGASLRFADPIPAGRSLVIDTAARTALMDGTSGRTVVGTWFAYPPGSNEVAFSASGYDAGALLTSVHRSAWR